MMRMQINRYTEEQIEYLREISPGRYNDEITRMFNEEYGTSVTIRAINSIKYRNGIRSKLKKDPRAYSDEEIEYIKEKAIGRTNEEVADLVNIKFDTGRTALGIAAVKSRHGIISFPERSRPYTEEQINYLKEISPSRTNAEITRDYNKEFGENRTENGISSIRLKHNIFTATDGRFQKGRESKRKKPIGSKRITKDGYHEIKVSEGEGRKDWDRLHKVVWEREYGPVPEGHIVIFGDGDRSNLKLDNLICIDRAQLVRLNQKDLIQSDAELTKIALNIIELESVVHELSKEED